jgi:hypothetical protein
MRFEAVLLVVVIAFLAGMLVGIAPKKVVIVHGKMPNAYIEYMDTAYKLIPLEGE